MKAMRLYGPMDLRVEDIDTPVCGKGEVLIRTECCGLCGSDRLRVLEGNVPFFPNTLGHEFSATVIEVGEGVESVKPGDLVIAVPMTVCHTCEHCKNGHFNQCIDGKFMGLRVKDCGAFAEYNVLPEVNILKVPAQLDRIRATFVEPLSVAIHTIKIADMRPGKDVAIVGAGTIGLLMVQAARVMGAKRVFVFDVVDSQLEMAKKFGADYCYNLKDENFWDTYLEDCGGYGCHYVLEAVGLQDSILTAMRICRVRGVVAILGHLNYPITIPYEYLRGIILKNELIIKGVWMSYDMPFPGESWDLSIKYLSEGLVDIEPLLYKVVPSSKVLELFEEWKIPGKVKGKMIIDFSDLFV